MLQKLKGKILPEMKIEMLEITDIFLYAQTAKINTLLYYNKNKDPALICFDIDLDKLYKFILLGINYAKVLEFNNPFNLMDIFTEKGPLVNENLSVHDRLLNPREGDIINLNLMPLVLEDIILECECVITSDNAMFLTIKNYYKKQ
jgi:hypothetical protein